MVYAGKYLYLVLLLVGSAYFAGTGSRLPARMAVHFDAHGVPNGWSSVPAYSAITGVIGFVLPLTIVLLVTFLSARTPAGPASRALARSDPPQGVGVARFIQAYIWWLAVLMLGFVIVIHAQLVAANHRTPPTLDNRLFLASLVGFLAGLCLWIIGWFRALRPAGEAPS